MSERKQEIYRGEWLCLMAELFPNRVYFWLAQLSWQEHARRDRYNDKDWNIGFTVPKSGWFKWTSEASIGEAMEEQMARLHHQEFLMREAEVQVGASRATIKALVEIERELSA